MPERNFHQIRGFQSHCDPRAREESLFGVDRGIENNGHLLVAVPVALSDVRCRVLSFLQ